MGGLRVPHIIRPNASGASPQAWVAFDVVTYANQISERKWEHGFRQATATLWRPERRSKAEIVENRTFTDRDEFISWLCGLPKSKERLGVVSHGLDFDAQVLDIHCALRQLEWRPTRVIIETGKWQQRWRKGVDKEHDGNKTLHWIDLRNFYPVTSRTLAKWLALPKLSAPENGGSDADWNAYCESQAAIALAALQLWLDFRKRFDLGYFSPTLAGQAFNAYRHRFMRHPIYVHVHADVIELEKEAYYGGRCEALWKGRAPKGDYCQVDVTSFYGAVQKGNYYPTKQVGHARRISIERLGWLLERYCAIARVTINPQEPKYPYRTEDGTIYPTGTFQTTLCTPELVEALRERCIIDIQEIVTYERAPIFDDYVDFFWDLRQRAMRVDDRYIVECAKRFLTALYGKFGQKIWLVELLRENVQIRDRLWTEYDWQDARTYEYRIVGGRLERNAREVMGRDTLLAIPAHVTAYGRMQLWKMIEATGWKHVYYMDTDSLIVSRVALGRIGKYFHANTLGGLRLIRSSPYLYIRAPKWYILGDTKKRGGVKGTAREIKWNLFEFEESRSMRWSLSHENQCTATAELVTAHGPLHEKLPVREMGGRVEPVHIGPTPEVLADGTLLLRLPLGQFPESVDYSSESHASSAAQRGPGDRLPQT